jgi:GNAT superfamily N-acetyltransferase
MAAVEIRPARPDEGPALRAIEIASKAHWGYPKEFMAGFASVISMSPAYIRQHEVWVLEDSKEIVGFHGLIHRGEVCELDHMWLMPERIGKGHGRQMFEHALMRAGEGGAARLEWEADSYAIGFYQRMGVRHLRWTVSQLGRRLPVMEISLAAKQAPDIPRFG